jgi:hypothetical protein
MSARRNLIRGGRLIAPILAAAAVLAMAAAADATPTTIYDNMPSSLPGSYPSLGYECCQVSEFGGEVEFAKPPVGKVWKNPKVTAVLDVWACQEGNISNEDCKTEKGAKFEWPIRFSVYEVGPGNSVGTKIAAGSKVFKIRYRPSVSPICNATQFDKGGWYDRKEGACYHGYATKITLPLKLAKLPEKAIISIAYNTSNYGAQPQYPQPCNSEEQGCPYDSLNVAVHEPGEAEAGECSGVCNGGPGEGTKPAVGSDPDLSEDFLASTSGAYFCAPHETNNNGVFGPTGPCWNEEQPVLKVVAKEG